MLPDGRIVSVNCVDKELLGRNIAQLLGPTQFKLLARSARRQHAHATQAFPANVFPATGQKFSGHIAGFVSLGGTS
jgi:hypothetical protein